MMATTYETATSEIEALQASFQEILDENGVESDSLNQTESVERATFSDSFQQFQEFSDSGDFSLYGVKEPQTIKVDSAESLMKAVETLSSSGGEIVLSGDNFGNLELKNIDPDVPLLFRAETEGESPVFESIQISSSNNLVFDGVEVQRVLEPDEPVFIRAVNIENSDNFAFINSEIHGSDDENYDNDPIGLFVSDSTGVVLENNDFHDLMRGMVNADVSGLTVKDNAFYDIRTDGADFTVVDNVVIEGNYFRDFYPNMEQGDHADAIQFWTNTGSSTHVEIRGNVILQGEGSGGIQGMLIGDKSEYMGTDFGYTDFTIEGNVYQGSSFHGITIEKMDSAFISNNTVIGLDGEDVMAGINVVPSAENIHISSNITTRLNVGDLATDESNTVVSYSPSDGENFIHDVLYNAGAVENAQLSDFGPAPGAETTGAGAISPSPQDAAILTTQSYGDANSLSVELNTFDPTSSLNLEDGQKLEWQMGDGNTLYGENINHTYEDGGSYDVTRITRNPDGSVANSLTKTVTVQSPELLDISFDNDLVDNSNNIKAGEWHEAPTYETGLVGAGASFSSDTNSFIAFDTSTILEGSKEFTVQFDINTDGTDDGSTQRPIWKPGAFGIQIENNDTISFTLWKEDGSLTILKSTVPELFDAEWHNLAFTVDGDANTASIYLDDIEIGTTDNAPSFLSDANSDLYVGGTAWGNMFDGTLDNLKMTQSVYEPDIQSNVPEISAPVAVVSESFDNYKTQTFAPNEAEQFVNLGREENAFGTSADDDQMSLFINFSSDDVSDGRERLVWNHLEYGIEFQDDDLVFYLWTDDNAAVRVVVQDPEIDGNGWHQVGFTYDEGTGAFRGYLDGEEVASVDNAGASLQEARYWDLVVGGTAWGDNFQGQVDNLQIYKEIVKPGDFNEPSFDELSNENQIHSDIT